MVLSEPPSAVMYADLRSFGGISNKDAARILLSAQVVSGGKSPRDRIESRTYLSRSIVHVDPRQVNPSIFADFHSSTQTLCLRIFNYTGGAVSLDTVMDHYAGRAAAQMCESLEAYGLNAQVYQNEVRRLRRVRLREERDRALMLIMLFCATGCLADARVATTVVEDFARSKLAQDLATVTAVGELTSGVGQDLNKPVSLGLLRMVNGAARPPIHCLSFAGSMVGSLVSGEGSISNVEPDVSRRHARIWHDGNRWLCTGLGSTNGTTIIRGTNKTVLCVEPPRANGAGTDPYPPQEIFEGDILCFGKTTQFLVLRIS